MKPETPIKRIVMLTPDMQIDRRILIEAETLIEEGYEVYLLAEAGPNLPAFEMCGNVPVERISHGSHDMRLRRLYWMLEKVETSKARSMKLLSPLWGLLLAILTIMVKIAGKIHKTLSTLSAYEADYFRRALFYRPDIAHVHDLPMLRTGSALKEALHIPLIYDMHEFYPEQPRLTEKGRRALRRLEHRHIHSADACITVNSLIGNAISERYGLSSIYIIQNAMATGSDFDPTQHYDRFREDYPSLCNRRLLLFQGWIAPGRGLEKVIRAMAHVKDKSWILLIMGYGEYRQELEKLMNGSQVADMVQFVPSKSQDELLSYSASADLGLVPYDYDLDINTRLTSPNKLYEFITAGLPMLSNLLPYVKMVLEQEGFGKAVDMKEPAQLARALDDMTDEEIARYRAQMLASRWKYLWNEEKKKFLEVYRDIDRP